MRFTIIIVVFLATCYACTHHRSKSDTPASPQREDYSTFINFWKDLSNAIEKSNIEEFKKNSLDSIWGCDRIITINNFVSECFSEIFDSKLISQFPDSNKIKYTWTEVDSSGILPCAADKIIKHGKLFRVMQVVITKDDKNPDDPLQFYLDFIETSKGYKFYGCDFYGDRKCCR